MITAGFPTLPLRAERLLSSSWLRARNGESRHCRAGALADRGAAAGGRLLLTRIEVPVGAWEFAPTTAPSTPRRELISPG